MTVNWHIEAQAVAYYRGERVELGWRFRMAVIETIERLSLDPASYERIKSTIHRCRVRRFPYCVVYAVEADNQIEIIAVAHHHRDVEFWDSRIRQD